MSEPAEGVFTSRIVAIANQKGGVGKTTTAINLATALAAGGADILLIDLDPQGNASTGLGVGRAARLGGGAYALLTGEARLAGLAMPTAVPNLVLVPAVDDLMGIDLEFGGRQGREFLLREALQGQRRHETILIDCPPGLGLLTLNALVAADVVLVPLQCEFFALEGISQLLRTIEFVRRGLNPRLILEGIVLTMFDRRNNLSEQVAADVRAHFGRQLYQTVIPRNVRISEAPSHGLPVLLYDFRSAGAQAYLALAQEFLQRSRTKGATP